MRILMSPQAREDNKIWYGVEENVITATINGVTDTFDFTDVPDGQLQLYDEEGNSLIETELPEIPILQAEKVDGELTVEILFSIDLDETDDRLLFPEIMTLEEFNALMAELVERDKTEENESREEVDSDG